MVSRMPKTPGILPLGFTPVVVIANIRDGTSRDLDTLGAISRYLNRQICVYISSLGRTKLSQRLTRSDSRPVRSVEPIDQALRVARIGGRKLQEEWRRRPIPEVPTVRRHCNCPTHDDAVPGAREHNGEHPRLLGLLFGSVGSKVRKHPVLEPDRATSSLFGPLLSYKVQSERAPLHQRDLLVSLNAISDEPMELRDFEVLIPEAKFGYLRTKKNELLKIAVLDEHSREELAAVIRAEIENGDIYRLQTNPDDTVQFTIMLELPRADSHPVKVVVGLKYFPALRQLSLVTIT